MTIYFSMETTMDAGNPWPVGYFLPICNPSGVDMAKKSRHQFSRGENAHHHSLQLSFFNDNIR
jgi:hypothetical protein